MTLLQDPVLLTELGTSVGAGGAASAAQDFLPCLLADMSPGVCVPFPQAEGRHPPPRNAGFSSSSSIVLLHLAGALFWMLPICLLGLSSSYSFSVWRPCLPSSIGVHPTWCDRLASAWRGVASSQPPGRTTKRAYLHAHVQLEASPWPMQAVISSETLQSALTCPCMYPADKSCVT
eukprot:1161525-Pelagomonas_calceolata.AAC.4